MDLAFGLKIQVDPNLKFGFLNLRIGVFNFLGDSQDLVEILGMGPSVDTPWIWIISLLPRRLLDVIVSLVFNTTHMQVVLAIKVYKIHK